MTPRHTGVSESRRDRETAARLATLEDRLEAAERQQRLLRTTVAGLVREVGCSLGCQCSRCEGSYTFVKDGSMYCPRCGDREPL
ncbi:hypothetical protein [Natrinema altunense]|uniref:Uncharacterized protein n=1 Tax=Natrinema altunense (strain JCM 12890 / CGMCC 1.3731 / AJ2) TaxID=1227494 RepID=L9ZK26_NATA2|nr:hypothetical protein C485_10395 [Natrinema altunense JCM 12890]